MTRFNMENLEGKGIKAEVLYGGNQYTTYEAFANAAGHPDAVMQNNPFAVSASDLEGDTVDVIAVGDHEREREGKLYVCRTGAGQKFIIGHKGVKIMEQPKLSEYSTDALYKEIERRAFEAGFKAGEAKVKEIPVGTPGICDLGDLPAVKPSRGHIVEQAKNDIEKLTAHGEEYDLELDELRGNAFFEDYFYDVTFHVNENKRAVTAVLSQKTRYNHLPYGEKSVGVAKCDPNDCFNEFIGKAIALHRALGLDVPAEYLNAPEPEGKQHGDIIRVNGSSEIREIHDGRTSGARFSIGKNTQPGSLNANNGTVINDTARYK